MARTDMTTSKAAENYYNKHVAPLKNVSAPKKIKCSHCDIVKPDTSFSETKKQDLILHMKRAPSFRAIQTGYISCINCTAGQKVEMACSDCGWWKGKDKYNKTQWKKDEDEAVCEDCNNGEMHRAFEPFESGDDGDDDSEGSKDGSDDDDSTVNGMNGLSLRSTTAGSTMPSSTKSTTQSGWASSDGDSVVNSTAPSSRSSKWAKPPVAKKQVKRSPAAVNTDDFQVPDSDSD